MNIKLLLINIFWCLVFSISYGQEYTMMDFGSSNSSYTSSGNWNNITVSSGSQSGVSFNLINDIGNPTGATLVINDSFDWYNTTGTLYPDSNLPFIDTATKDSLFGESAPFNGVTNPTGGFILSNLDPLKYYSFSIFASRMSVSDNRETLYTITGQNTLNNSLNTSNNTSNTANILNIQPKSDGTITFVATTGVNNNNANGFFYLGAIQMITSASPLSNIDVGGTTSLSLLYPKGGELWEVGKTPFISWQSQNISNVLLEYSIDDGVNWLTIGTFPANSKKYNWSIPNHISTQCKVRISANGLTGVSNGNFSITNNENVIYKIVVLGSSTAAGAGPSDINNAWVWRYRDYLTQSDTRYVVENLALGGYVTYNLLPTGTTIPSGVNKTIDTQRNITKALTLNPNGIIINLPSNDAASGYPVANQIANYHLINNTALAQNTPVWISSPQPRNFGSNTTALNIQLDLLAATPIEFGEYTFDFWTDLGIVGGNGINPLYDKDGIHMNDAGHQILFDRVVAKGIHTTIKSLVDAALSTNSELFVSSIKLYPNPFNEKLKIVFNPDSEITISVFDSYGRLLTTLLNNKSTNRKGSITWNPYEYNYSKGMYLFRITENNNTITKKIIFN